jgi:hypothetical protein
MRFGSVLAVLIAVALSASTAIADWQYTRWGMSPRDIVDASKGEARIFKPGDQLAQGDGCLFMNRTPIAIIPKKKIGEFQFAVKFCAVTGQNTLTSVVYFLDDRTPALRRALMAQYGNPISVVHGDLIWNDAKNGNTVTFSDSEFSGKIEYKKLGTPGL